MNGLVIGATDLLARPAAGGDATVCALIAIALLGALLVRREVRRASVGANGGRELRLLQVAIAPLLAAFAVIVVARLAEFAT